ncbi:MAG: sigma-70 family RNA polymerase sigma factor [Saprospiraceae bacterium]|nr:sigma-70 family RNA polymerase sigma factor [Saprospiraceae bacterium]
MENEAVKHEDKLIAEALSGSEPAFKALYEAYKKSMFLICLRYGSGREEAEDMLQDGFISVFKDLGQFQRPKGSFYSWAGRIMVNACLQSLRKKRLNFTDIDNEVSMKKMAGDFDILSQMEAKHIIIELQKMPVGYRTVFNLYYLEGYSHKEIAEKLGITESTSKTQLMKSKHMAKTILINELQITR